MDFVFLEMFEKAERQIGGEVGAREHSGANSARFIEQDFETSAEHERLTIGEIEPLTRTNRNILKVRLRELGSDNFIEQNGRARASFIS